MRTKFKKQSWIQSRQLPALPVALLLLAGANLSRSQTFTVLHSFDNTEGREPQGELLMVDGVLYGTASLGDGGGKVYRINPDGSGFSVLTTLVGEIAAAGLSFDNGWLYGISYGDGGNPNMPGRVFRVLTNGTGFTVLKQFQGFDGAYSSARPLIAGNTLYASTGWGGSNTVGTVFKLNLDGSGFESLHHFDGGPKGRYPSAGLALSGGRLFGTTAVLGGVYCIHTNGGTLSIITNLAGPGPASPYTELFLADQALFGSSSSGGDAGFGTVFRVNTDGSGLAVLWSFSVNDQPYGGVTVVGNTLFGTTMGSFTGGDGVNGFGSVFSVKTNGTGKRVLISFNSTNGANPRGTPLVLGNCLYGTTRYGGSFNRGVLFRLIIPDPPAFTKLMPDQTAETGDTVRLRAWVTGSSPLSYQWYFNCDTALADATNSVLELCKVGSAQTGAYTVVVTNLAGGITGAPAILSVIPPVSRREVPGFQLSGNAGTSLNLEYTADLGPAANWLPLDTVILTNPPQWYFDLSTPLPPQRFYRAWQTGAPSIPPSLQLPSLIPALTLTGSVSSQVRVDGINAIGPTDAWFTLATVTLTATPRKSTSTPPRLANPRGCIASWRSRESVPPWFGLEKGMRGTPVPSV